MADVASRSIDDLRRRLVSFVEADRAVANGTYPFFRPIGEHSGAAVRVNGRELILLGSNDYLGLTHHPHVLEAAHRALDRYGTSCTGSRLLNGTLELHEELEARLAQFLHRPAAIVFPTGYQALLGSIATLAGRNDTVLFDRHNHASIIDAGRLGLAVVRKYRHNDLDDLRRMLGGCDGGGLRLVVTDGVFSMLGELAALREIVELAGEYDALVMIDDAHGIGVLGETGRGTAEALGVEEDVHLLAGTFSKAFAAMGGFLAGDAEVIRYLRHHARPFIFSASVPPPMAAAALAALEVIETEPALRLRLAAITARVRNGFRELGFNIGQPASAIIPVILGERELTGTFCKALEDEGIFASAVVGPAVPPGMDLVRTSFMATHTDAQVDKTLAVFGKVGRALGVISKLSDSRRCPSA